MSSIGLCLSGTVIALVFRRVALLVVDLICVFEFFVRHCQRYSLESPFSRPDRKGREVTHCLQECVDIDWVSSTGYSCSDYGVGTGSGPWCTESGGCGSGWGNSWGTFTDWANNGHDASTACCACGGGSSTQVRSSGLGKPSREKMLWRMTQSYAVVSTALRVPFSVELPMALWGHDPREGSAKMDGGTHASAATGPFGELPMGPRSS